MNQTATPTAQDWRARAAALAINGHAFIDGRYVDAARSAPNLAERDHQMRQAVRLNDVLRRR